MFLTGGCYGTQPRSPEGRERVSADPSCAPRASDFQDIRESQTVLGRRQLARTTGSQSGMEDRMSSHSEEHLQMVSELSVSVQMSSQSAQVLGT